MKYYLSKLAHRRTWLRLALLAGVASYGGCAASNRVFVVPVEGEVRWRDQPMSDALVMLHPASDLPLVSDLRPRGRTDAQGRFRLTTYDEGDGAPPGEYLVTIQWPQRLAHPDGDQQRALSGPDRLQGKYAEPQSSGLKLQVVQGQTKLDPIVLP